MATSAKAKKAEPTEAELLAEEFGYLDQHKTTSHGRTAWAGVAMSIQAKDSQPLKVSVIIWIDNPTCEKYGIDVKQPGLRFNIFNDDQRVKISTVAAGSLDGVKAIIHTNSICMNWHRVPATIRRDKQPPKSVEGVKGAKTDGIVQLAWMLPDWFFGPKEAAE